MLGLISRIFDTNDREIKSLAPTIEKINSFEDKVKKLKDEDFPKKTAEFKKRIEKGESIYDILPEAFAVVREAAFRSVGMRHYDVQLMAATVLARGGVAEQKTGEGKTLSATPALYLNALTGNTVHLVTVNDYLARRDAGWMGTVFAFLGMRVSSIINDASYIYDPEYRNEEAVDFRLLHLKPVTRKEAYEADIVYGINSEFGFDYLRDNMVFEAERRVQSAHFYAIIDEVDSVLIDEARTPHIISMPDATPSNKYYEYSGIVSKLSQDTDYKIDEKARTVHLTDRGIEKIEKLYNVRDIYEKDFDTVYHIEAALKANTLFQKNKDYIVRDGKVILVDEFTGRLLEGRRLSEGLHQAIEAKEGVTIQQESKTLATVSLQNYFRMYDKLAGMTGTAVTEAEEFQKIYKLDVVVIPTHRDMVREDLSDQIYKTTKAKIIAVVKEIEEAHKKGQPVLVGTTSIDKNEIISDYLKHKGIKHEVLNAKNHMREAMIIKEAGRFGAVTVATNMAGRGVDIILGGEPPSSFDKQYDGAAGKKKYDKDFAAWRKAHEEVLAAGGLYVIGTEKHESRRIDNQLRGRAGRQGDPGKSVFIVSLEDDLMRIFGGDQISGLMTRFNFPEDQPLSHGLVSKVLSQAQVKVEGFNFESRKHLLDYDDVLNKQREIIYDLRDDIVDGEEDTIATVMEKVEGAIEAMVELHLLSVEGGEGKQALIDDFSGIIPFDDHSKKHLAEQIEKAKSAEQIKEFLMGLCRQLVKRWEDEYGREHLAHVFKIVSLSTIDNLWMDHLTAMEDLRTGIGLRGYGQRDPLVEYKNEAYGIFERLIAQIDDGIARRAFRVNIAGIQSPARRENVKTNVSETEVGEKGVAQPKIGAGTSSQAEASAFTGSPVAQTTTASSSTVTHKPRTEDGKKLGRNDPCWCGSGKKWKKCHYPELPA